MQTEDSVGWQQPPEPRNKERDRAGELGGIVITVSIQPLVYTFSTQLGLNSLKQGSNPSLFNNIMQFLGLYKPKGSVWYNLVLYLPQRFLLGPVFFSEAIGTQPPVTPHAPHRSPVIYAIFMSICGPARHKQCQERTNGKWWFCTEHCTQSRHNSQSLSWNLLQGPENIQKAGHSHRKVNTSSPLSVSGTHLLVWATWYWCIRYILAFTIYTISLFDSLQPSYQLGERKYCLQKYF